MKKTIYKIPRTIQAKRFVIYFISLVVLFLTKLRTLNQKKTTVLSCYVRNLLTPKMVRDDLLKRLNFN